MITKEITEYVISMTKLGYRSCVISEETNLTRSEIKKILIEYGKKVNNYNEDHIQDKYEANRDFFCEINPTSILDLYSGQNRFWYTEFSEDAIVIDNDSDKKLKAMIHSDANELLKVFVTLKQHFDLVDVDPYGSPADLIRNAIEVADKGLILTFGDKKVRHYTNRNKNYYRDKYGINKDIKNVKIQDLIDMVIKVGIEAGKKLNLYLQFSWKSCERLYFTIEN